MGYHIYTTVNFITCIRAITVTVTSEGSLNTNAALAAELFRKTGAVEFISVVSTIVTLVTDK